MAEQTISVVTGANRGLGLATARQLACQKGHLVVATARNPGSLASLRAEVESTGHRLECHALDVTDEASATSLGQWLQENFGQVDVLVNNAGIGIDHYETSLLDLSLDILNRTLETNLFGVLRVTQAIAPLMTKGSGRIVNLSSGLGQLMDMTSGVPAYRISKTALNAVTRILATELRDRGIKVNSVCPGWCRTDMGGPNAPRSPEEGVDTVVWLATLPDNGPTGGFFRDRKPIPW